jgi:large subunit ribosomal protein L17
MRHQKHRHMLGVKKEHRSAMVAALATALFSHKRITTTLAKAKALRPFAEQLITMAKKASQAADAPRKLHLRRQAAARLRDPAALKMLFDTHATEFLNRPGGYTRIYKLVPRKSDASPMALIELIPAGDEGYKKSKGRNKAAAKGKARKGAKASAAPVAETPSTPTEAPATPADEAAAVTQA